uniref:Uncharacterized protein n=1 Tax=Salvator merianae TaxID=96440 RepID=A0A8D0BZ15_SALMN
MAHLVQHPVSHSNPPISSGHLKQRTKAEPSSALDSLQMALRGIRPVSPPWSSTMTQIHSELLPHNHIVWSLSTMLYCNFCCLGTQMEPTTMVQLLSVKRKLKGKVRRVQSLQKCMEMSYKNNKWRLS